MIAKRASRLFHHSLFYSVMLHLILFVILAFWQINIAPKKAWHSFELFRHPTDYAQAMSQKPSSATEDGDTQSAAQNQANPTHTEEHFATSHESSLLEMPDLTDYDADATTPPGFESELWRDANSGATSSLTSRISLLEGSGRAYFLREKLPAITPLMDDNVVLEFRLKSDGRVDMSSIKVISYRKAEHFQSLRKAMEEWRFGFTGRYDATKTYRIRCRFTLS